MIAFEVFRNGKRVCLAAADDLCVLNATINAVGKLGKKTAREKRAKDVVPDLFFSVGGLTQRRDPKKDVHVRWKSVSRLRVGDSIEVRIVDVKKADLPKSQLSRKSPAGETAKRMQS